MQQPSAPPSCQHMSAYVSICQHMSAYVSIRQHTAAYGSIRQHTSAYGGREVWSSMQQPTRQHTAAYGGREVSCNRCNTSKKLYATALRASQLSAYVSICQHMSAEEEEELQQMQHKYPALCNSPPRLPAVCVCVRACVCGCVGGWGGWVGGWVYNVCACV
jgi:hypothetical protein